MRRFTGNTSIPADSCAAAACHSRMSLLSTPHPFRGIEDLSGITRKVYR
jgi:hypothetical protein